MENFAVHSKRTLTTKKTIRSNNGVLFHNDAGIVKEGEEYSICDTLFTPHDHSKCIRLSAKPLFLANMAYDYFIINSSEQTYQIIRINKAKKSEKIIGFVQGNILGVFLFKKGFVVVTETEVLLFDIHFEQKAIIDHTFPPQISQSFTSSSFYLEVIPLDDSSFLLVSHSSLDNYYSIFLSPKESYDFSDKKIKSAFYQARYNRFGCLIGDVIKFFEPNGLELGPNLPIGFPARNIYAANIDGSEILVVSGSNKTLIYYMLNFHWYQKYFLNERVVGISGRELIAVNSNKNIQKESLNEMRLDKETIDLILYGFYKVYSDGCVLNGNNLAITDFDYGLVPPPYYHMQIPYDFLIRGVYTSKKSNIREIYVVGDSEARNLEIIDLKSSGIEKSMCVSLCDTVQKGVYFSDFLKDLSSIASQRVLSLRRDISKIVFNRIFINDLVLFDNFLLLQSFDTFYIVTNVGKVFEYRMMTENSKANIIHKVYNIRNTPVCLLSDGSLFWHTKKLSLILNTSYHTEIIPGPEDSICIHNGNKIVVIDKLMDVACKIQDALSVIVYKDYLIYTTNNNIHVLRNYKEIDSIYVDENQRLLGVVNRKILSQTRFGTLESVEYRAFIIDQVEELIDSGYFAKAADLCDRRSISYQIFHKKGFGDFSIINSLKESQASKLISEIEWNTQQGSFLFGCELLRAAKETYMKNHTEDLLVDYTRINIDKELIKMYEMCFEVEDIKSLNFYAELSPLTTYQIQPSGESCGAATVSKIFAKINPNTHLHQILNLLISINRIDLAFFLPNISAVVPYLLTRLSKDVIIKAVLNTLNMKKIREVYEMCKVDVSKIVALCQSSPSDKTVLSDYQKYTLLDYIEDRDFALLYFGRSERKLTERLKEYINRHSLYQEARLYSFLGLFDFDMDVYLSDYLPHRAAFYLLAKRSDQKDKALDIAMKHLLWKEAIEKYCDADVMKSFIDLLQKNEMYYETGCIYENYAKDYHKAYNEYIKGCRFHSAYSLLLKYDLDSSKLISKMDERARSISLCISETERDIERYRERLEGVKARFDEGIDQSITSFSRSTTRSTKSAKNALTKDRKGGIYEYEYVLNKIRERILLMKDLVESAERIKEIASQMNLADITQVAIESTKDVLSNMQKLVEKAWEYKRYGDDPNRPVIPKPEI